MRSFQSGLSNPVERSGDRLGFGGILAQVVVTDSDTTAIVVPTDAKFAFAEAVGGGSYSYSGRSSGGGAGEDAILEVVPGETLTPELSINVSLPDTKLYRSSTLLLTALGSRPPDVANGPGASGKYPGGAGLYSATVELRRGGRGGGRLGGKGGRPDGGVNGSGTPGGIGGGAPATNSGSRPGQLGCVCLTFFASYEETLAFAKAVYGGSWAP